MAKSGILAQSKPAAATNTLLYQAPIGSAASAVLTIANDGTGSAYDVGLKEWSQKVTVDASTYKLHEGDVITNHRFELNTAIPATVQLNPGDLITSVDEEKTARFHAFYVPEYVTYFVKEVAINVVTIESVTGSFAAGNTITKGSGGDTTTALVYEAYDVGGTNYIAIGPETVNGSGTSFAAGDSISNGSGASATISTGGIAAANDEFVFSTTTSTGTYNTYFNTELTVFDDRPYRFDLADSSMTGRDFKLSTVSNGEWGPDGSFGTGDDGSELTTGKTSNGTAGSVGAYVQYDLTQITDTRLYFYDGGTGTASNANYGGDDRLITTTTNYTYEELYVYDLKGGWTNSTDTFQVDGITYTLDGQTSGKWGYVRDYSSTTLKIIAGDGSGAFAGSDTFLDSPLDEDADRATVTISSIDTDTTALDTDQLIVNGATNAANNVDKITSIVVGPGQSVIVESATQNNTFSLVGFEDNSTDVTIRNFGEL